MHTTFPISYRAVFSSPKADVASGFDKWDKPPGITMVQILCVGAGAGGGGGCTGTATTNRGGGGGGGSGAMVRWLGPAFLLPEQLYVQVGMGGDGGAAGVAGTAGARSYVSQMYGASPRTYTELLLASGNQNSGGGGGGTVSAAGSAGAAGTIATIGAAAFHALGIWSASAGLVAGAGGAHTGGLGVNVSGWTRLNTGGAGGGGVSSADFIGGRIQPGVGIVVDNSCGISSFSPFYSSGGAGGNGINAGAGLDGTSGGFSSGGGGGGAGTTGGRGGQGGGGVVIFNCW